jgi:hypothetical protein
MNAATLLGQSKTADQGEIDSACEVVDFLRFNASYPARTYEEPTDVWNRLEYAGRPAALQRLPRGLPGSRSALDRRG